MGRGRRQSRPGVGRGAESGVARLFEHGERLLQLLGGDAHVADQVGHAPLERLDLLLVRRGLGLAFTRYSFVYLESVHESILFLAFNTSTPPVYFAINIAQCIVSPRPPGFAIQHTVLVMAISCKGQG